MWVRSLGWEDPLEEGMATHSCLENPHGQRSLAGCSPWGRKESDTAEHTAQQGSPSELVAKLGRRLKAAFPLSYLVFHTSLTGVGWKTDSPWASLAAVVLVLALFGFW